MPRPVAIAALMAALSLSACLQAVDMTVPAARQADADSSDASSEDVTDEPVCTMCDESCVFLDSDVAHCGECDNDCRSHERVLEEGTACVDGACVYACEPDRDDCDPDKRGCETDLSKSKDHCGMCGLACNDGMDCTDGVCLCDGATCSDNEGCCDNSCTDLLSNDDRCGKCGDSCDTTSETCVAGACVPQ